MPSFSVWKASGEILYLRLLLVFGKQVERFCTETFFWCVESKWRNFVHTPSFGVWKASGEILYTRRLLVFGKRREKFCTFGEHLYIFECDQSLLEKRVCILTTSFVEFGGEPCF
jgi:hypothetical protein